MWLLSIFFPFTGEEEKRGAVRPWGSVAPCSAVEVERERGKHSSTEMGAVLGATYSNLMNLAIQELDQEEDFLFLINPPP